MRVTARGPDVERPLPDVGAGRRGVALRVALFVCAAGLLQPSQASAAVSSWSETGPLATGRAQHTATLLGNGRVLVAGGRATDTASTSSAELYDPLSETWSSAGAMGNARSFHTATRLSNGRVLVVGGLVTAAPTASAELFDPASGWSAPPPLAAARSHHTATPLADGRVLVAGGFDATGSPAASVEIFDPTANGGAGVWTAGPPLGAARAQHTATMLTDGRVLVVGGTTCASPPPAACPTATSEVFDPAGGGGAGVWSSGPSAGAPRYDHVAVRLASGQVLVAGGREGSGLLRRSAELFHPAGPSGPAMWTDANQMSVGRTNFAAALLPGGGVLVAGGGTGNTIDQESAEIWSPASGGWGITAFMDIARRGHTLTTLAPPGCGSNCGKVLVAAGVRGLPGSYLRSAALFDPDGEPVGPAYVVPAATRPPEGVRDLTARALSLTRIGLAFSAPGSPPARRYVVKQSTTRIRSAETFARARSLCGGNCQFSPRSAGDRLTLTVTRLRPKRTYFYALRAIGADGRPSAMSNVASARTRFRRPGRVRGLRARAISATRIRLSFRATGAPPARRYLVKQSRSPITSARRFRRARSLCGRSCRFRPRAAGVRLSLLVTGLRPATRYCFAVRARDGRRLAGGSRGACARTKRIR